MGTSAITISALNATAGFQGNKLAATLVLTGPDQNIPNLQPDSVEFHSSTTNDRSTASLAATGRSIVSGIAEARDDGLLEETIYYYWARVKNKLGNYGAWYPGGSTSGIACKAKGISGLTFGLANGKVVFDIHSTDATVSAGAGRISIKTNSGNDPSASDPVFLAFPNSDITLGNSQIRAITAAFKIDIPQFSNFGVSDATPFRLWGGIVDDGGTLRIAVKAASKAVASTIISSFSDGAIISSSAVSSATNLHTYYTDTAVSSKPVRRLFECVWNSGLASMGTFDATPSMTRLLPPGVGPGTKIPVYSGVATGSSTITTTIPYDDTIPQNTEGEQYDSFSYAARAACNFIDVEYLLNCSHSAASEIVGAMFVDSGADAVAVAYDCVSAADKLTQITLKFRAAVGSTASKTYKIRFGACQTGTLTINGAGGSRKFGGKMQSTVEVNEVEG